MIASCHTPLPFIIQTARGQDKQTKLKVQNSDQETKSYFFIFFSLSFRRAKQVLGPESTPKGPRAASRIRKAKTAAEIASKENAVRQRYGMEVKRPNKAGEGQTLDKLKNSLTTGLATATETGRDDKRMLFFKNF